jgi:hypothetical protein
MMQFSKIELLKYIVWNNIELFFQMKIKVEGAQTLSVFSINIGTCFAL